MSADIDERAGYRIVSLTDRGVSGKIREKDWRAFGERIGRPVFFEHVCLPPSPIVLSDLLFVERYADRVPPDDLAAIRAGHDRLRAADLILIDDIAEMALSGALCYAVLSHDLVRHPLADLITIRLAPYGRLNHRLPMTFVAGPDLPLAGRTASIAALSAYLGKPIFRIATVGAMADYTQGWDYRDVSRSAGASGGRDVIVAEPFLAALAEWIERVGIAPTPGVRSGHDVSDPGHFCSHLMAPAAVDALVDRFDRFCLAGQESSGPFVAQRIVAQGKTFVRAPHYAPGQLEQAGPVDYDVIVALGPKGPHPTPRPVVAIESTGRLPNQLDLGKFRWAEEKPESARDWHCPFDFARQADRAAFTTLARAKKEDEADLFARRSAHRERSREAAPNRRERPERRRRRDAVAELAAPPPQAERLAGRAERIAARKAAAKRPRDRQRGTERRERTEDA